MIAKKIRTFAKIIITMTTNKNIVPPASAPALVAIVSAEHPARMAWLLSSALHTDFKCESSVADCCSFVARSEFDDCNLTLYPVRHRAVAALKVRAAAKRRNVSYLVHLSPAPTVAEQQELCGRADAALGLGYCYIVDNQ
jgi:hypothetical protein